MHVFWITQMLEEGVHGIFGGKATI